MSGGTRTFKDVTKALQSCFTTAKPPSSLSAEARRVLQNFIGDHPGQFEADDITRANAELKTFWDKYVSDNAQKIGAFVGVLRELRTAIMSEESVMRWYELAIRRVISEVGFKKPAVEDAQDFLSAVLIYDEDDGDAPAQAQLSGRICTDLLDIYISRTRGLADDELLVAPNHAQISQQVETVLIAFGRKMPKQLFHAVNDLLVPAETRLQALALLSSFLRHQSPHLYLVLHTPVIDSLLKCLMNDTSTTVLSVALTSLIMLLPHIPGSLVARLPRLFLIYSRLLCWEKFSPLSTEAQKNLVTDNRVSSDPDDEPDRGDVGLDANWEKARPKEGLIEASTPEILNYFTYLYGLYPLNFMAYIRKPRKYLKSVDFPRADEFDLDQTVIRNRSEQFRQVHLLHPNFYNLALEEENINPKWPKMDPADVVAECHSLCTNSRPVLLSPGPPPTGKLPDLPPLPPLPAHSHGSLSNSASHTSLRSGSSWRDTQSTAVSATVAEESPILRPLSGQSDDDSADGIRLRQRKSNLLAPKVSQGADDFLGVTSGVSPEREKSSPMSSNLAYLQREITLLRNDLNFERWHKAQYSQHIGQLMRKNVKDATVEAETLNLINANRALKQQLEQVRGARESTLRDSALTRKQASNLEANMTERLNKMKKDQESWSADAAELRRLRAETKQLRDLLSTAEARELNKGHKLEVMKQDLEQLAKVQGQLQDSQRKNREYEYREFEFEQAKREQEILQSEKDTLQMRVQRHEQDRERIRRVYADKIVELEAQLGAAGVGDRSPPASDNNAFTQQALLETQGKFNQLKKAHSRLLERYTDLDIECQSLKSQLETYQNLLGSREAEGSFRLKSSHDGGSSFHHRGSGSIMGHPSMSGGLGVIESVYDLASEYGPSEASFANVSRSDPTSRRYQQQTLPASPPGSSGANTAGAHNAINPSWISAAPSASSRQPGGSSSAGITRTASRNSGTYNPTAPLGPDEQSVYASSAEQQRKKEKIQPDSQMRVYGRGGAQNIKMKSKDKDKEKDKDKDKEKDKPEKRSGFKAFKNFV